MSNASLNPSFTQYTGTWNSAQNVATVGISRPTSLDSVRKITALVAGGKLSQVSTNKIPSVKATVNPATTNPKTLMPTKADLKRYAWNLPPHSWSRPVDPTNDGLVGDSSKFDGYSDNVNRRARIYYYMGVDSTQINSANANTEQDLSDRRYGFQFLWNPQSFSTAVSVNMDITPSANDKFVKVVGAFPSAEVLSVEFVIDRTNDLYCLRSHDNESPYFKGYGEFYKYYSGWSFDSNTTGNYFNSKLQNLQTLGTLADLEYLYKAINGAGWKNVATGRESSDIGFLSPTLLKIEIGPVAYVGYVNNLGVEHLKFTKGMVPMQTNVSIQFNLMATAGLSSKAATGGTGVPGGQAD